MSKTPPALRFAEVPFAGPDAGAIDFLLSNRASAAVVGSFLANVAEKDTKSSTKEGVVNLEEKVGSNSGQQAVFRSLRSLQRCSSPCACSLASRFSDPLWARWRGSTPRAESPRPGAGRPLEALNSEPVL